jgi:hypothetical protein
MTLDGMVKHNGARRIHFVFPAQAIWETDIWGPGDARPYPAPMVLLTTLFARRADDAQAYTQVVVPFLDRMITKFPVAGYPPTHQRTAGHSAGAIAFPSPIGVDWHAVNLGNSLGHQ